MDITKALAAMNTMNNYRSNPPPAQTYHQQTPNTPEDVDFDYIIQNKPPIKYVREYFENAIENLEESE